MSKKIGNGVKFRQFSQIDKLEKLLNPNSRGISKKFSIEKINAVGVVFGNGGGPIRDGGGFDRKYVVQRFCENERYANKITAIKLNGWQIEEPTRTDIPQSIREQLIIQPCVFCGGHHRMQIDHKDGWHSAGSKISDFQATCQKCQCDKRQDCKECKESKQRFDARTLGFNVGWIKSNITLVEPLGCIGCYRNDPREFRRAVSVSFVQKQDLTGVVNQMLTARAL